MDILGQSALLVASLSFALGISVLARNFRNTLFLSFFIFSSLLSAWALFFFMAELWQSQDFYRVHLFFNLWITPAALLLIRQIVRVYDRLSRVCVALATALSVILTPVLVFGWDSTNWVRQVVFFVPGFIVLQVLGLMIRDLRLRRQESRSEPIARKTPSVGLGDKRIYIYIGALVTLSTSVMDHVPWLGDVIPVIGNVALTVYLFFLSQAITQQRLLNFGAILARFIVILTIALTLTGIYSLLFRWIAHNPALFLLNSFIVSILITMVLDPLRAAVAFLAQRYFADKNLRLQALLREGQRRLIGILEPEALFSAIRVFVERVVRPRAVALFVLQADGTLYRRSAFHEFPVTDEGAEPIAQPEVREVLAGNPLIEACLRARAKGDLPILFDTLLEAELERSASRTRRARLKGLLESLEALGGNLLIPLLDADEVLGFVLLSVKEPPQPWSGNWALLQVIYPYFEQAARTLRNMEVYVRSREKERLATLGEMAAGLAHEIRNPLGAIKGAAQYLDPQSGRPESRFLQVIVEEVDRLNRVVTQFLEYSKSEAPLAERVELRALAARTLELLRPTLPAGVVLDFDVAGPKAEVMGSPEKLKQVILNLVQNSIKALQGRERGLIRVSLTTVGTGRRREACLSVEDDGVGIRAENLKKLFIPFFTTTPSGTGLGLSISQKIVESHRGRIEVSSEEGRFARFSVYLPAEASGVTAEGSS